MEKYTDRYHPQFIPGTYSIYSSAVIRHQHHMAIKRYRYLLAEINNNDEANNEQEAEQSVGPSTRLSKKKYRELSNSYNYKYSPKRPLGDIPDLKTRYGVILQPQPTNSRNDPLNWSKRRKTLHSLILLLVTAFTAALSNDASAPTDSINAITGISYDLLNDSAGVLFVSIVVSTWLYSPFDYLLGRKSVILFGAIFAFFSSIWYALMNDGGDSYGSQVLTGFSFGCADAHVQLCFASIFFRHQLGAIITIYNLAYSLGTYLGPLCANFISFDRTFRWVGWSGAIASGVLILIVLFLFEENSFDYAKYSHRVDDLTLNLGFVQNGVISNEESDDALTQGYFDKPFSYLERYKPFRLPKDPQCRTLLGFVKHYFQLLLIPVRCIVFPPVIYAGCICGLQNAILTFYLTTEDTMLYSDPFNYSSAQVALMNIPCIIGSVIGCLYAGSMTDYFILWMARKNSGIVESEFRLYFAFLSGTVGAVGLLMFGFGISRNMDWRVFYIGLAFISYMFSSSTNLAMLYVMDTYRELTLEVLVCVAFINNIIGCIFTFACSPWLQSSGTENTYIALAVISLGVMHSSGGFIYFGKRWRKRTHAAYVRLAEIKADY